MASNALPDVAAVVDSVALALKSGQLAHELSAYKNSSSSSARKRLTLGLSAVLWRWLEPHEACVAGRAGVDGFPVVTTVPTTSGRVEEPLKEIAGAVVGATRERYRELLAANPQVPAGRDPRPDRFTALTDLDGEPVLLLDDTWTSGGRAQSAAAALRAAGSGPVGLLVIGRHFSTRQANPIYKEAAEDYVKRARARGWDWGLCRICDPGT